MMETHGKIREPLCSTGQDQHLSAFSNGHPGQVASGAKQGCNCIIKNCNKHVLCELILGETDPAQAQIRNLPVEVPLIR